MEIDLTMLAQVLTWLISGGGAAAASYFFMENIQWLKGQASEAKRYWSLGLASAIAVAAYCVFVFIGYQPQPETTRGWIEALFAVGFAAVTASQVAHGRLKLRVPRV